MAKKSKTNPSQRPKPMCAYCGTTIATTRDHVVPRGIFDKQPLIHVTVPCCLGCNAAKSDLDQIFRDYLILDWQGCEHPVAKRLIDDKVGRAIASNRSKLAGKMIREARLRPHHDAAGLYVGEFWQAEVDGNAIVKEVELIVRGLTYRLLKERIPQDHSIEVNRVAQLNLFRVLDSFHELGAAGPVIIGSRKEREVVCLWLPISEDKVSATWLLLFYERVMFLVHVISPAIQAKIDAVKSGTAAEDSTDER